MEYDNKPWGAKKGIAPEWAALGLVSLAWLSYFAYGRLTRHAADGGVAFGSASFPERLPAPSAAGRPGAPGARPDAAGAPAGRPSPENVATGPDAGRTGGGSSAEQVGGETPAVIPPSGPGMGQFSGWGAERKGAAVAGAGASAAHGSSGAIASASPRGAVAAADESCAAGSRAHVEGRSLEAWSSRLRNGARSLTGSSVPRGRGASGDGEGQAASGGVSVGAAANAATDPGAAALGANPSQATAENPDASEPDAPGGGAAAKPKPVEVPEATKQDLAGMRQDMGQQAVCLQSSCATPALNAYARFLTGQGQEATSAERDVERVSRNLNSATGDAAAAVAAVAKPLTADGPEAPAPIPLLKKAAADLRAAAACVKKMAADRALPHDRAAADACFDKADHALDARAAAMTRLEVLRDSGRATLQLLAPVAGASAADEYAGGLDRAVGALRKSRSQTSASAILKKKGAKFARYSGGALDAADRVKSYVGSGAVREGDERKQLESRLQSAHKELSDATSLWSDLGKGAVAADNFAHSFSLAARDTVDARDDLRAADGLLKTLGDKAPGPAPKKAAAPSAAACPYLN